MNFDMDTSEFECGDVEEAVSAQMEVYLREVRTNYESGLRKLIDSKEVTDLTNAERFGICVVARVPTIPAPHLGPKDTFTMQTVECAMFMDHERKKLFIQYVDPQHKNSPGPIRTVHEIVLDEALKAMGG